MVKTDASRSSRMPRSGTGLVNGRGDDDADAERGEADHDSQRHVLLLDQFLPELEGRDLVHDHEGDAKNSDADESVDDGVGDDECVHGVVYLWLKLLPRMPLAPA